MGKDLFWDWEEKKEQQNSDEQEFNFSTTDETAMMNGNSSSVQPEYFSEEIAENIRTKSTNFNNDNLSATANYFESHPEQNNVNFTTNINPTFSTKSTQNPNDSIRNNFSDSDHNKNVQMTIELENPYENEIKNGSNFNSFNNGAYDQPYFNFETVELDPGGFLEINKRLMDQMDNLNQAIENTFYAASRDIEREKESIENQKKHINVSTELQKQVTDKQKELEQLKLQEQKIQEQLKVAQKNKAEIDAATIAIAVETVKKVKEQQKQQALEEQIRQEQIKKEMDAITAASAAAVQAVKAEVEQQMKKNVNALQQEFQQTIKTSIDKSLIENAISKSINANNNNSNNNNNLEKEKITVSSEKTSQTNNTTTTSLPKVDNVNTRQLQFQTANVNQSKRIKIKGKKSAGKIIFWFFFWLIVLAAIGLLVFWILEFIGQTDLVKWPGFDKPDWMK